jgi:hypothetical protein
MTLYALILSLTPLSGPVEVHEVNSDLSLTACHHIAYSLAEYAESLFGVATLTCEIQGTSK